MSQTMYPAIPNSPITELVSNITDTQTTIQVADVNSLPDAPNIATLGIDTDNPETILYEGKNENSLTDVIRGFQGTAKSWDTGTQIARTFTEYDYNALINNVGKKTNRFVVGTSTSGWTEKDCDYLCDGTNDQEEIIQALNDLPATGGEVVILDGTYNITASINIPKDNVSLRGNGNATILKRMYNSTNTDSGPTARGLITLNEKSGCKIQGLQIDGNKATYTASYNYGICLSSSSSNNTVTDNTCNNNRYGIYLTSSIDNTITGNTCNGNSNGIYLYSSSNNTVTGNTCNGNSSGIYLHSSINNTITGNICNGNSNDGIYLHSSSNNNTITDNTCNNNSNSIYLYSSNNNTITGNTCNGNSYGIYLYSSSSNNTVTGNTCNGNSNGIYLYSSSSNNTVIGNTCNGNSYGIRLYSSINNTITSNTCSNNNIYGIYLSYSSNNTITGNTCIRGTGTPEDYTTSQYTIFLYGTDNDYNLISSNNCMGKAVSVSGGTGNTVFNNKWDDTDDFATHLADGASHSKTARFVVGTSTAGWTLENCDYLCDGTDDQEEIITALAALPATGGEIIILDGTYNITATIGINKDNVSIRGNGNATILKRMWDSSSFEGVIMFTSVEGCKVENLQIDGNKATYTATYNYGIYLSSSTDNTVTGNTCSNNKGNGIYLTSSNNNTITGNICNNNGSGIYLNLSENNTITGNTCTQNDYGICLFTSKNNTIMGNTCSVNAYGIYLYSSNNNTITSNICNNNDNGIHLSSSSNNTITGNICIRGTGKTSDYVETQRTIRLSSSSNYNLITSNNCMGKAVAISGGTGNTVFNNKWNDTDDFTAHLADEATLNQLGHIYHTTLTTTLDTDWDGTEAPYSKTQIVTGIIASDNPIIDVVMSGNFEVDKEQANEWSKIYRITTADNSITLYATDKPTVGLPIQLKVVR